MLEVALEGSLVHAGGSRKLPNRPPTCIQQLPNARRVRPHETSLTMRTFMCIKVIACVPQAHNAQTQAEAACECASCAGYCWHED